MHRKIVNCELKLMRAIQLHWHNVIQQTVTTVTLQQDLALGLEKLSTDARVESDLFGQMHQN
jgi:hypothetical protein